MDGLSEEIMIKLCEIFKISSLHDHQKIAIESALLRKEDSIICMPTGGGKSLCFEAIVPCCKLLMDDTLTPVSYPEGSPVPRVPLPPICACATMSGTAGICHSYSESSPQAHSSPPVMLCCAECWSSHLPLRLQLC